ncbi:MAG TPA: hypothetical protein VJT71_18235 [Pyrinomonadaceae bacterium]|nr:hypothetical protein [Pyrinomonadaceae bacterium]
MSNLTEKEFSKHTGTEFQTEVNQKAIALKLTEVKGYLAKENEQGGMERFSIFFNGPGESGLAQGIYHLSHEQMGEIDIFLVPISGDKRGYRYEAVFNYYKE